MSWLVELVAEVRAHAEVALLRRLDAGAGFADARLAAQIYLRDEAALARVAGGTLRPRGTHSRALTELEHTLAARSAHVDGTPLATLLARTRLDEPARGLVAIALAYATDLDTRELVHALAAR